MGHSSSSCEMVKQRKTGSACNVLRCVSVCQVMAVPSENSGDLESNQPGSQDQVKAISPTNLAARRKHPNATAQTRKTHVTDRLVLW